MTEETSQQLGDPERDAAIVKEVQQKIAALVTAANKLPRLGDEYELCASFKMFKAFMQQQEVRLQKLIAKCMETSGCPVVAPKAGSTTDVFLDRITRANDAIVERAGICMDEIQRSHRDDVVHVPKSIVGAESTKAASARQPRLPNATLATGLPAGGFQLMMQTVQQHKEQMRLSAVAISRPQKDYKIAVDNSRNTFVSKLRVKHHSREKPRGLRVVDLDSSDCQKDFDLEQEMQLEHPYRVELEHFQVPQRQLESAEPIVFEPLDKVTLTFVNTKIGLENLRDQLNKEKEFAVDLEHNNTRTFLGLTCLLQISTRTTDYIVDPFQVWDEMHILNEPFANPVILKVFHGADSDIQWLQRDFGIHVVNMFDTYHAMKRLEMPKFSLQWLVQNYCDIVLSKAYQTSDWRLRPLTQEQLDYARCDTHYLLYCYDRCREDLLKKGNEHQNLLRAVYGDSVVVCGRAYEKPQFDPLGFETLLHSKRTFNSQQVYALKELWMWRDNVARTEDEGLNYVLPAHMMMYIAEALPREAQGITACCNPVPEMVKKHVLDIHKLVYAARDQPLILGYAQKKNIIGEEGSFFRAMQDEENRMNKVKSVLRCALDFSHSRFDEEIGRISVQEEDDGIRTKAFQKSFFSFMDPKQADCAVNEARMEPKIQKKIQTELDDWATPFERYQIGVKKAAEAEEKKRLEEAKMKKEPTEEKKRYSHHDPVNRRPTNAQSINVNVDDIQLNNGPDEGPYTDSQVYTKKALARKRKHAKKAADIKFGAGGDARSEEPMEEGEQESDDEEPLVFTKEEGEDEGETTKKTKVEPVDYSQYEASMFNQKAKRSDTFDPFHQQARIERNKKGGRGGKRGRGGFHRMGKQSTGYKPQK